MRKLLFLFIFVSSLFLNFSLAKVPVYQHKEPFAQLEFENLYHLLGRYVLLSGGKMTGVLLLSDGSVTSPSLSFSSETGANTGLYWIAQNSLGIASQGIQMASFLYGSGCALRGTGTNDSAAAGFIGEYIESVVGATANPATGVWGDLTSKSFTAGDWSVTAVKYTLTGNLMTGIRMGISTTAGNDATGLVVGSNWVDDYHAFATGGVCSQSIPAYRMSFASTTTVYLKYQVVTTGVVMTSYGRLSGIRVR